MSFNGRTYVCYGKPHKGKRLVRADKMDVVVCAPKDTVRGRLLTDSEVETVKSRIRDRLLTSAQYAELRKVRAAEGVALRKRAAEARQKQRLEALAKARAAKAKAKGTKPKLVAGKGRYKRK